MEILAGTSSTINKELLKKLWLRKLPANINIALISSGKQDIAELLEIADKIWEFSKCSYISAIHNNVPNPNTNSFSTSNANQDNFAFLVNKVSNLENDIGEIKQLLQKLTFQNRGRDFSRNSSPSSNRGNSKNRTQNTGKFCWYHFKFGTQATKCIQPCDFPATHTKN